MMMYEEQKGAVTITSTTTTEPISIESDRESTKSSDSDSESSPPKMQQNMFIWNPQFEKWHECSVEFNPPSLQIVEYEDQKLEVNETQLRHLEESWFHGTLSRREARVILQDFKAGDGSFLVRTSESFRGKFAVSFMHQSSVKHVVIESRWDPVAGVLYNITPNGPVFNSLYELIEEGQRRPLIQNHVFNVQLTCSPPKPDMSWLHRGVKSLSQAEQLLRKEHRDGAFFVYKTQSQYAPYIVAYRSNGSILHNLITFTDQSNGGYTLNHVTSQVLYKVIHYFMENPINDKTVLRFPVSDRNSIISNCGIALRDWYGDRGMNELKLPYGALITNIKHKTEEWSLGDHRGDKQKYFKRNYVRLLTKDELAFVNSLRRLSSSSTTTTPALPDNEEGEPQDSLSHTVDLCIQSSYKVEMVETGCQNPSMIVIQPASSSDEGDNFQYKLSCSSFEDLENWYKCLQKKCSRKSLNGSRQKGNSRCTVS